MSYAVAILIIFFSTLTAACGSLVVYKSVGLDTRRRHHEVGNPVFLQVGVMFAVLLAFVFSEVWAEYNTADTAISGECAALHGAAMLADALPAPQGQAVNRAILVYVQAVAKTEWPLMEHRQLSVAASDAMRNAIHVTGRLELNRNVDVSNQAEVLTLLEQAHGFRETRLFQMTQGLPWAMWLVLTLMALVLIASVLLAGVESRIGHVVFAAGFTGCTVMVLVLVRMLDYPFEGALALANDDFVKVVAQVAVLAGA
jgi:hypothetical protein